MGDYMHDARWLLSSYPQLKTAIVNLESRCEEVFAELCPSGVARYPSDDDGPPSTVPHDMAETMLSVTTAAELMVLRWQVKHNKNLIASIERAIASMTERGRKVIELHYQQDKSWKQVATELHLSRRQVVRWGNEAVRSFAVAMYGVDALKEPPLEPRVWTKSDEDVK